jgi:hypothetical protein
MDVKTFIAWSVDGALVASSIQVTALPCSPLGSAQNREHWLTAKAMSMRVTERYSSLPMTDL